MPKLGAKTTALEALQGADLTGKVTIVTGGNSGIGVETVRALAVAGSKVILCARSVAAGEEAAAAIKAKGGIKGEIVVQQLDLADLTNVRAFVKRFLDSGDRLDILVCNAGVMACPLTYTKDGFEMQFGTNHMGHFVLVTGLLDKMVAQGTPCRIVSLSSMGHNLYVKGWDLEDPHWKTRKYDAFLAYGMSKMANVLMAKELATRLKDTQVRAYAVHPGVIATNLARTSPGWVKAFVAVADFLRMFGVPGSKSVEQGAATSVWAATAPELEQHSGAYLSDCQVAKPNPIAEDPEAAAKLWKLSEELANNPPAAA